VDPWRCDVCRRPIRPGQGTIALLAVSEDGVVGGYPEAPTPDEQPLPEPPGGWPLGVAIVSLAELEVLGEAQPRIAFRVCHGACDPDPRGASYGVDVGEARTLAEWRDWVVHVGAKRWMGKSDVLTMLNLWSTNRNPQGGGA
jgi:hypothetical protein